MSPTCAPYQCPGCPQCAVARPRQLTPSEEARITRALANDPPIHAAARPTVLRIVTMPRDQPAHDPATCTHMICDHPACIGLNARRIGQGSGNANPFRRAA